jgi:hypothetical protein
MLYLLYFYDKNNKYLRSFVINHKNTINTIYLVMFLWLRTNFRENIHPPLSCVHENFSRRSRVTFKWFVFYFEPKWYTRGFFLPNGTNVVNFSIGTILQWNTLGYCNLNTYENEELAFIGQRSGEPLKWRQFDEISKDTISKIKYTALSHNLMKLGWNILLPFMNMQKYNNWMIFARLGDKKQTRRQSMSEIVFSWGVSEIKCKRKQWQSLWNPQ